MPPLLDLAPELVEAIGTHIDRAKDFGRFRRANSYLEKSTRKIFTKKFFTERCTDLGSRSLERIVEFAAHREFAVCVRKLQFLEAAELQYGESDEGPTTARAFDEIQRRNQRSFELLCAALLRLPSLVEIEIGILDCLSLPEEAVFDTRYRMLRSHDSFAYSMIVLALSTTEKKIKALKTASEIDDRVLVDAIDHAPATESLEELRLNGFSRSKHWLHTTCYTLANFIGPMINLTTLQIHVHGPGDQCERIWVNRALMHLKLPSLKYFGLFDSWTKPVLIRDFVRRHKSTLTGLKLHRITVDNEEDMIHHVRELLMDPHHQIQSLALCNFRHVPFRSLWFHIPGQGVWTRCLKYETREHDKFLQWCHHCMLPMYCVPKNESESLQEAIKDLQYVWHGSAA